MLMRKAAAAAMAVPLRWFVSCTAGVALKTLPRAEIERPYTLPEGVHAWSVSTTIIAQRDAVRTAAAKIRNITPRWYVSLSDDWGLILGPPIGVSHQFVNQQDQLLGATFLMSSNFEINGGFVRPPSLSVLFEPSMSFYHRIRLSRGWAWNSSIFAEAFKRNDARPWGWSVGVGTGPLLQMTDTVALLLSIGAYQSRSYLSFESPLLLPEGHTGGAAQLGLVWSAGRQWDIGASLGYEAVNHANGYHDLYGSLTITNLW